MLFDVWEFEYYVCNFYNVTNVTNVTFKYIPRGFNKVTLYITA